MKNNNIAIDFGSDNIKIGNLEQGIIIDEPCVVAVDTRDGQVVAIGNKALEMMEKTYGKIVVTRPIKNGIIADFRLSKYIIKKLINKATKNSLIIPKILIAVTNNMTPVQKNSITEIIESCGIKKMYFIQRTVAAIIANSTSALEPQGRMVVDIENEITEIATISMNNIDTYSCVNIGSKQFDLQIKKYIKSEHNIEIGLMMSKDIKEKIGNLYNAESPLYYNIKGRNMTTNLPQPVRINSNEMVDSIRNPAQKISDEIIDVFKNLKPDLVADIIKSGILLIGDMCKVNGLCTYINKSTKIKVWVSKYPTDSVILGSIEATNYIKEYEKHKNKIIYPITQK